MRAPGYVAATDAAARAEAEASLIHYYRQQASLLGDSLGRAGVEGVEKRRQGVERLQTITYDEALRGSVIIGSPERVARQLLDLKTDLGLDGIMLEMNCGGLIPHDNEKAALRLLCQEVMPGFR
jgi:alkanesulfonate monooxygenase SsuD/methylene tetrahydromethanopterin reductase-like flavin-dependent oxidoreductase (luciferase family)